MRHFILFMALVLMLCAEKGVASNKGPLAPTPPMGWNSWDSYGLTVNETEFKENVDWLHRHLQRYGWNYVVVDEGWYLQHPENAKKKGAEQGYTLSPDGRYLPAVDRFPSSGGGKGLKPLADYAHSLGLKFGIHIIRGIPRAAVEKNLPIAGSTFHAADAANTSDTCAWNSDNYGIKDNAAGQAYYDSLAQLYASWGVDFLKVDCISHPYKKVQIQMVREALRRAGHPIVLSLSPGPTPLAEAEDVRQEAQMWRISSDMWDIWSKKSGSADFPQSLKDQFVLLADWAPYSGDGRWPDADMLPIGYLGPRPGRGTARESRLNHEEERTMVTLWSIARSPLVLGTNLTKIDPYTESLLINPEVIAVDQHSANNHPVIQRMDIVVWGATGPGNKRYIAVFNRGDHPMAVSYAWQDLGIAPGEHSVRNLWERRNIGRSDELRVTLPPHGSELLEIKAQ